MKSNSKAFDLIKNLSMSEKRHFKIFAEKHVIGGKNNYIILFEVLDKELIEDDEKIVKKLNKKKYPVKYLSADKNYLYQLLLKSLTSYHASRNSRIQIKEMLIQVDILHQKGLYEQAMKIVEKAKKVSLETENYSALLECNVWYRRVAGPVLGPDKVIDSIKDSQDSLNLIHSNLNYLDLYYQIFVIRNQKNRARKKDPLKEVQNLVQNPLLKDEKSAKDLFDKIKFNQIWAQYYFMKTDHEKEFKHNSRIVELIHSNDNYLSDYPFDLLSHKARQLSISKFISKTDFNKALKDLKSIQASKNVISKERFSFQVFLYSNMSQLAFHIYQKSYKEGADKINIIKEEIEEHRKFLNNSSMISFYYMFAYLYTAIGDFKSALKEVNTILNDFEEKDRKDLYHFTHLLNLIIHFELENVSLIPYLLKSTVSYFKKNNSLYPAENLMMNFFKKVTEDKDQVKMKKDFEELQSELNTLNIPGSDQTATLYFDLFAWVDSKVKSVKMMNL